MNNKVFSILSSAVIFIMVFGMQPVFASGNTEGSTPEVLFNCSTVSDVSPQECETLVALFLNTTGFSWINHSNWFETTTVDDWFGVTVTSDHITQLTLQANNLVGTLPNELGNLTYLTWLDLSQNPISGSIPSAIGNLTDLTFLSLGASSLSGIIPPELGSLTKLTSLDLSSNQLSGPIPASFGNLVEIIGLFLDTNQLNGSIPTGIGNMSKLVNLSIRNNELTGSIPLSFTNLISLDYFYFYDNHICEPSTAEFITFKSNVSDWRSTGYMCDLNVYLPCIYK